MKKLISIFLSVILVLSTGITASAESEEAGESDVGIFWSARVDILEMPDLMIEYKTNKDAARKYLNEKAPEDFTYNFSEEMDAIAEAGYILLPQEIDIDKIKPGDFTISINAGGDIYSVHGSTDDMDYQIYVSEEMKNLPYKPIDDITIRYGNSSCRAMINWHSFGGEKVHIVIDSRLLLEEFAHNLVLKPYPLKNGFIDIDDNLYYGHNGTLLKGWYKIGGNRYYFDENNIAAKGEYKIGNVIYTFDENGVYKSSKKI